MITHEYVLSRENRACLAPRVSLHLRALLLCHPQSLSGVALLACAYENNLKKNRQYPFLKLSIPACRKRILKVMNLARHEASINRNDSPVFDCI